MAVRTPFPVLSCRTSFFHAGKRLTAYCSELDLAAAAGFVFQICTATRLCHTPNGTGEVTVLIRRGGGSIPLKPPIGINVVANDLNPVSAVICMRPWSILSYG